MSRLSDSHHQLEHPGKVYLIGAGPGDPGLITLRAVELLRQADVVVHDRLVNRILMRYAPQAKWIDVGKCPDHHPVPQSEINAILVEQACCGLNVVRLKGGDPFVFGRGGEEALALAEAGIPFEVVPGVTSAIAVPAYAGIPVTQRNLAGSVTFIAGHRSTAGPEIDLKTAAACSDTVVFLMGVHNLPAIVNGLLERGRSPDTPVALLENGTTPNQKVVVGTLADIQERAAEIQPPAITVVGEVVRLREKLAWFEIDAERPLLGLKILNTRPQDGGASDEFTDQLERLGAEVTDMPAMRIVPPEDFADLDRVISKLQTNADHSPHWDWIVFTSPNAVKYFLGRILETGADIRLLHGIKLGAVGEATARTLETYYLKADFIPQRYTGLNWAAEVGDLEGRRILLPRSGIATPDLVQDLEKRGAQVEVVTAYTVAPAQPDPCILERLAEGGFDMVAFFSPSAVRGLMSMLETAFSPQDVKAVLSKTGIACVGPTTAAAVESFGLQTWVMPQIYTAQGLVEALVKWRAP